MVAKLALYFFADNVPICILHTICVECISSCIIVKQQWNCSTEIINSIQKNPEINLAYSSSLVYLLLNEYIKINCHFDKYVSPQNCESSTNHMADMFIQMLSAFELFVYIYKKTHEVFHRLA